MEFWARTAASVHPYFRAKGVIPVERRTVEGPALASLRWCECKVFWVPNENVGEHTRASTLHVLHGRCTRAFPRPPASDSRAPHPWPQTASRLDGKATQVELTRQRRSAQEFRAAGGQRRKPGTKLRRRLELRTAATVDCLEDFRATGARANFRQRTVRLRPPMLPSASSSTAHIHHSRTLGSEVTRSRLRAPTSRGSPPPPRLRSSPAA